MKDWPVEIKSVQVIVYRDPAPGSYTVFEVRDRGRRSWRRDLRARTRLADPGGTPGGIAAVLRQVAEDLESGLRHH